MSTSAIVNILARLPRLPRLLRLSFPVRRAALGRAVLVAFTLFWASAAARAGGLEQLQHFLERTQSARGQFTQVLARPGGEVLETTHGTFAFARPGKFRWQVQRPFEQLMVADGKTLWFHDVDLDQVTTRAIGDAIGATPAAILFGSSELARDFELRELGEHEGLQWVEALPRSQEQGFDRIAIGFRDQLPRAMEVRDAFGRISRFGFDNLETDPALPPDTFRFTPPPGADVIAQ